MEARNHAPQGPNNIGPIGANVQYDDLQNWQHPLAPYSSDMSPDYLATDGVGRTNTATAYGGSFTPHSSMGCVGISEHEGTNARSADEFVTQQLTQPLLPGHRYRVEFWALNRTVTKSRTKLAFSVTNGAPTYDASQSALLPSPNGKVVTSETILDRQNWTSVGGTIDIPYNESNNQWVTMGYSRDRLTYDDNAPSAPPGGIYYVIDDVALYDLGCGDVPSITNASYTAASPSQTAPTAIYAGEGYPLYNTDTGTIDMGGPGQPYTYTFAMGTSASNTITPLNAYAARFQLNPCPNCTSYREGSVIVTKTYPGGCSTTSVYYFYTAFNYYYAYSPNPTSDELTVTAQDADQPVTAAPSSKASPFTADLYDKFGKKVKSKKSERGRALVDTRDLPEGLYTLRVGEGKQALSQRIQVAH